MVAPSHAQTPVSHIDQNATKYTIQAVAWADASSHTSNATATATYSYAHPSPLPLLLHALTLVVRTPHRIRLRHIKKRCETSHSRQSFWTWGSSWVGACPPAGGPIPRQRHTPCKQCMLALNNYDCSSVSRPDTQVAHLVKRCKYRQHAYRLIKTRFLDHGAQIIDQRSPS